MASVNLKASNTIAREGVRKWMFRLLGAGIACGLALWFFTPARSTFSELGLVLVLVCFVPMSWTFGWLIHGSRGTKWGQRNDAPRLQFVQGTPVPELAVSMRLLSAKQGGKHAAIRSGHHTLALIKGTEGFTVRFKIPEGVIVDSDSLQRIEVQFLKPALALPHFTPDTTFRMVTRDGVIGEGQVIESL